MCYNLLKYTCAKSYQNRLWFDKLLQTCNDADFPHIMLHSSDDNTVS